MAGYTERTEAEREFLGAVSGDGSGIWHDQHNEDVYLALATVLRLGGRPEAEVRRVLSAAYGAAISEHGLDQDRD